MRGGQSNTWSSPYPDDSPKDEAYRWLVWSNVEMTKAILAGIRKEPRARAFLGVANEHRDELPRGAYEAVVEKCKEVL